MRIDNSHDVVNGSDSNRTTIYIDRSIPQFSPKLRTAAGYPANLWKYLSVHETHEANLMSRGLNYNDAHQYATARERAHVERDGVSWPHYQAEINGHLSHIEHKKAHNPPPRDQHIDPHRSIGRKRCKR